MSRGFGNMSLMELEQCLDQAIKRGQRNPARQIKLAELIADRIEDMDSYVKNLPKDKDGRWI